MLNSLRSSKEQGQSNFNNPGTMLLGAGADFDLTPELRVSANVNHLWFAQHRDAPGAAQRGHDPAATSAGTVSAAAIWRPQADPEHRLPRCPARCSQPGEGFRDLFANSNRDRRYYSVLLNAILSY